MSDYADGAEAMRKAILKAFADTYNPSEQSLTREIENYRSAIAIVRGVILEDRRSMVCLTPKQAHGLADWMRRHGAAELDELAPALTVLILHRLADEADGKGASSVGDSSVARTTALEELEDCRDAHMEAWALLKEVRDTFTGNDADGAPGADGSYWLGHTLALKIHYFLTPPPQQDAPKF